MTLLVVGSVALDSVKTPFGEAREVLGGAATYFSVAASYYTSVSMIAVVGTDFPKTHIDFLKSQNIEIDGLEIREGKTFRWAGAYGYDLNERDTIDTSLNVFENFNPKLLEKHKESEYVFLANIDPVLQHSVINQVESPRFCALDTMNFWIDNKNSELKKTISEVDAFVLNDSECRHLAEEPNLIKAARKIIEMGPRILVVKKGEHGALLFTKENVFSAPAFPIEDVFDPTGAGDSFAGGFMGHIAKTGDITEENMRRAILYGTVMASFCVEKFSVEGMVNIGEKEIEERFSMLREMVNFGSEN
ncbi:MAG: PfkB family carbohydrate kinase [Actinomycetota bacterium]|nr:PfkB family carbohydrate kinase [Actinomycetota bacterium]